MEYTLVEVDTLVIGAGQAGLAVGYFLAQFPNSFCIIEGNPALGESWRSKYDSMILYTPVRLNGLPGLIFPGNPDSYPTKDEVAEYLTGYAQLFDLPVALNQRAMALHTEGLGFSVTTQNTKYMASNVVVATGPYQNGRVPSISSVISPDVLQIHSSEYTNPDDLPDGPVLIVGCGNAGARIARELSLTRKVFLSVRTRRTEWPQTIANRDIFWWMNKIGLVNYATIETRLGELLSRSDPLIGIRLAELQAIVTIELVSPIACAKRDKLILADGGSLTVKTIVWATGYSNDYSWMHIPVLDNDGRPIHRRGITPVNGLYFIGLPWQSRRDSALLGGVGRDARQLVGVMQKSSI